MPAASVRRRLSFHHYNTRAARTLLYVTIFIFIASSRALARDSRYTAADDAQLIADMNNEERRLGGAALGMRC